jgi:hypothetical protein
LLSLQQSAASRLKKEKKMNSSRLPLALAASIAFLVFGAARAQPQGQSPVHSTSPGAPNQVIDGTRFLAGLEDPLSTKDGKAGNQFRVRTLEPLETSDGGLIPAGADIRGHIDKVEQGHQTGRARLWLTFDDIQIRGGWAPIVAIVSDIPGVHSVKVSRDREGEIEARSSKGQDQATAAAAGAFVGAMPGAVAHNGKDAAFGAAVGAATAFMLTSGLGQEITLDKNTKLELTLDRPLFLDRK